MDNNISYVKPFSFNFNGRNSKTDFGLTVNSYDFLMPEKRQRKIQVPFVHGLYDYSKNDGKRFYNERTLRLNCAWIRTKLKTLTRTDIREISYWLSQRGKIVLDIEPDKYYVGEIYDGNELTARYNYDRSASTSGEFEIDFICEPFAYGGMAEDVIETGTTKMEYKGTVETPCIIVLKNNNNYAVNNVQIVVNRRKN